MMSANLDLVRSIYADAEWADIDRFLQTASEWMHPDAELVRPDGPELGTWTGRERVEEVMRDIFSAWDDYRQHSDEYRELDDERVLVVYRRSGRGKTSGMEITELGRGAALFHIRDGKVTRIVAYFDSDRALADLGLAPEGDSQ
jgi:ketosteroid isomerase-like protein